MNTAVAIPVTNDRRWFINAGEMMYPEPVYLRDGKSGEYRLRTVRDPLTGKTYRKYRFVLPEDSSHDLGAVYIPEEQHWKTGPALHPGLDLHPKRALSQVLFSGYMGKQIKKWLVEHVSDIVGFFSLLKTEWRHPGESISTIRYSFNRAFQCYEKNVSLCIGQLLRFGGSELIVAVRVADGGEFLKVAEL